MQLLEREYGDLYRNVVCGGVESALVTHVLELLAEDYLGREVNHGNARYLADIRNGSGRTRVYLYYINLVVVYDILDVYKTDNVQCLCELFGVVDDNALDMLCEVLAGVDGDGVAGVDACALNVLHDTGDNEILAVTDGVYLDLGAHHVLINKHGVFELCRGDDVHILGNVAVAVRDDHVLTAENVGRTQQNGVAEVRRSLERLLGGEYGFSLGAGDTALFKQLVEQLSVLRSVDVRRLRAEYAHAEFGKVLGKLYRGLSAELNNAAVGLLGGDEGFYVLAGERVEVKSVAGVKVGGYGFGVVVADYSFAALFFQRPYAVNRAVVELDALSYSDRTRTENDDLFLVGGVLLDEFSGFVLAVERVVEIGGVSGELRSAGVDHLVYCKTVLGALLTRNALDGAVEVAVLLRHVVLFLSEFALREPLFKCDEVVQLADEPLVYLGDVMDSIDGNAAL